MLEDVTTYPHGEESTVNGMLCALRRTRPSGLSGEQHIYFWEKQWVNIWLQQEESGRMWFREKRKGKACRTQSGMLLWEESWFIKEGRHLHTGWKLTFWVKNASWDSLYVRVMQIPCSQLLVFPSEKVGMESLKYPVEPICWKRNLVGSIFGQ